jgi:hypothetical protein
MTDLGELYYFLRIEVQQSKEGIFISQESHAKEILKKFKMEHAKSVGTPCIIGFKLRKDGEGKLVNSTIFQSTFGGKIDVLDSHKAQYQVCSNFGEKIYGDIIC